MLDLNLKIDCTLSAKTFNILLTIMTLFTKFSKLIYSDFYFLFNILNYLINTLNYLNTFDLPL